MGLLKRGGPEHSISEQQRHYTHATFNGLDGITRTVAIRGGGVEPINMEEAFTKAEKPVPAEFYIDKQQAMHRQMSVGVKPAVQELCEGMTLDVTIQEVKVLSHRMIEINLQDGSKIVLTPVGIMMPSRMNLANSMRGYVGDAVLHIAGDRVNVRCRIGSRVIHWEVNNGGPYPMTTGIRVEHLKQFTKPKARTMKELNTAALIRKDTRTVKIGFPIKGSDPEGGYTYVTQLDLAVGDTVVTDSKIGFAIGKVLEVHDSVMIDPESDMKLSWIVQKVDTTAYETLKAENQAIDDAVAAHYRNNLQKGYRQRILGEMSEDALALLPAAARN